MHSLIDSALSPVDKAIELSRLGNALMPFFKGPLQGFARRRKRYAASTVLKAMARNQQVTAGLFLGMRYANLEAKCSAILPKLLGTYEREMSIALDRLLRTRRYNVCIDIGSAEGYYAVGIALRQPQCKVYAVDSDPSALELCGQNARINGCFGRIQLLNAITASQLHDFYLDAPSLVISDCEGYEKTLFTERSVSNLATCDVVIEVHDFIDSTIEEHLRQVFRATHKLEVVMTIPDRIKAMTYDVPEVRQYDIETRSSLLSEFRPGPMKWFVFTPKSELARI